MYGNMYVVIFYHVKNYFFYMVKKIIVFFILPNWIIMQFGYNHAYPAYFCSLGKN